MCGIALPCLPKRGVRLVVAAQGFQRQAATGVKVDIVRPLMRRFLEIGQRQRGRPVSRWTRRPIQVGAGQLRVAFERERVVGQGLRFLAELVEDVAAIEVAPGELRPESDAGIEVAHGQRVLVDFHVADAALQPRPVVAWIEAQRLVQFPDRFPILAGKRQGGGAPIMIARACRGQLRASALAAWLSRSSPSCLK